MKSALAIAALSASASALALKDNLTSVPQFDVLSVAFQSDDVHYDIHSDKCGKLIQNLDRRAYATKKDGALL